MTPPLDTASLIDALRDDPRVRGVARLHPAVHPGHLVIASTWDGRDALTSRLRELAAHVVETHDATFRALPHRLEVLTRGGERLDLEVVRIGELKPSADGEDAEPLLDAQGLLAQWVEWSRGRPRPARPEDLRERAAADRILGCEHLLREFERLSPGSALVTESGAPRPLRHALATRLRLRADALPEAPAAHALRARIDEALRAMPHTGAGLRVTGPGARERFLAVADAEGFAGDRVLLDAAEAHVREATGRDPVFEVGFALATFDQVEARYALGEAVGGCKPPLVPGLLVGVAVTPADELAFWAAPAVREPLNDHAAVADDGARTVVPRTAGKGALLAALTAAVDDALDGLPSLLRRSRGAHLERTDDPEALLRTLHLPRTHVLAAGAHGALTPGVTRLTAALGLARAAADMEPIVARKLELAAGRLLLAAVESGDCEERPGPLVS